MKRPSGFSPDEPVQRPSQSVPEGALASGGTDERAFKKPKETRAGRVEKTPKAPKSPKLGLPSVFVRPSKNANVGQLESGQAPEVVESELPLISSADEGSADADAQPTVDLSAVAASIVDLKAEQPSGTTDRDAKISDRREQGSSQNESQSGRRKSAFAALLRRRSGSDEQKNNDDQRKLAIVSPPVIAEDPVVVAQRELKHAERARKTRERKDQKRFTAQARYRKRYWLVSAGAVLLLGLGVVIGVFTPIMAVRDVEVVGANQVDPSEIEQALGRFNGVPLALVSDVELHRALEPFPLIQRYSVERIPPDTLRVHIEERQPVIGISGDSGYRLLDAAGVLTGEVAELPVGIVRASGGVVDAASAAFSGAATVVRDLPEDVRVQVAQVSASSDQDIEFLLHSGVTVVWGEPDDTQRKSVVLRAMLGSVPGATRIDLSAPEAPVFQ